MKARLLRESKIQELYGTIPENLNRYRSGDFEFLQVDTSSFIELKHEIDESKISEVQCEKDDFKEPDNCIKMYEAMGYLSFYLARDRRLWIYIVHTNLLSYARTRWPIPEDDVKAVKHIQSHFFIRGARDFERNNVASRLWWMASLCNRSDDLTICEALECFLYRTDVRANIIERPTTSQNITVFYAILKKLKKSLEGDKKLFERDKFRPFMRELNLIGGVKLFGVLSEDEIGRIIEDIA